jgi:hypothetical protein
MAGQIAPDPARNINYPFVEVFGLVTVVFCRLNIVSYMHGTVRTKKTLIPLWN